MTSFVEKSRTATHEFVISGGHWYAPEAFQADFRPLNPKTGRPWQRSHRIDHGADVEPKGWEGRPCAYSTLEAARAAVAWKQAQMGAAR